MTKPSAAPFENATHIAETRIRSARKLQSEMLRACLVAVLTTFQRRIKAQQGALTSRPADHQPKA